MSGDRRGSLGHQGRTSRVAIRSGGISFQSWALGHPESHDEVGKVKGIF